MAIPNPEALVPIGLDRTRTLAVAERIAAIQGYGDLLLTTREELPCGNQYNPPNGDPDQRPKTNLRRSDIIGIEGEGLDMVVKVRSAKEGLRRQDDPGIILPVGKIAAAHVDHPFGRELPLNNTRIAPVHLDRRTGVPVLRWPPRFYEHSWRMWAETENTRQQPDIGIVRLYSSDQAESLQEAKEDDPAPGVVLISRAWDGYYLKQPVIMTSRLGPRDDSPVIVRRPQDRQPKDHLDIEMLNVSRDVDDGELMARHLERVRAHGGKPISDYQKQLRFDEAFLYAVHD